MRDSNMSRIRHAISQITMIPKLGPVEVRQLVAKGILSAEVIAKVEPLLVEYYTWK